MKNLLLLCGIVVAGVLGYMIEPSLRSQVTGAPTGKGTSELPETDADMQSAADAGIDLASLSPEQLPRMVILKEATQFSDESSGLTLTVAAGSPAKLIRLDGSNVAVRPGDTAYTLVVPISKTDLIEQLIANPPAPVEPPAPEPAAEPQPEPVAEPAPQPAVEPEPEPTPEPAVTAAVEPEEPAPQPEPVVETEPQPEPEPEPEPAPEPTPAPEPAPTPTPAVTGGPTGVVAAMQESIRNEQIKEFTFAQVLEWKPGPNETVDGVEFQTGMISYKAETIFGVKTIQAKALIKDGAVIRWMWPKSGMEIK